MGWAIMFLVLIALVIILSISLINWKIQIYKVIVQLNAILNRKTKKLVTVSLSDRRLEHLVEIINQIVSKDNIYLGEIQKKENELKENISCLSHDLRTPLTSIRGYLQLLSSAPDEKRAEYISALSGKALRLERLIDDFYQISLLEAGQYPFYYEKVELCSLLTEILLDNYSIFSVNGIEPQIEIPNMDIYLNADRKACMPHIRFHDLRHTAATNMHQLTGDFYTVGEVLGHTLAGIGVSLGLSMNFEAVTARYVDVRLERKKEVLDAYHGAVKQADPAKAEKAEPKKAKSAAKKKSSDLEL